MIPNLLGPMIPNAGLETAIGAPVIGGTQGSVLFIGAGGVLAQDNANFFWNDSSTFLQIGSTSKAFLEGAVSGAYDGSTSGSVRIQNSNGPNSAYDWIAGPNGGNAIPVPTLRPTVANKVIAWDMCPNGTPSDGGFGLAWIDLCNTDQWTAGNAATQTIHITTHAARHFIGAAEYNSGAILPLNFGTFNGDTATETIAFTINTNANTTVADSRAFHVGNNNGIAAVPSFLTLTNYNNAGTTYPVIFINGGGFTNYGAIGPKDATHPTLVISQQAPGFANDFTQTCHLEIPNGHLGLGLNGTIATLDYDISNTGLWTFGGAAVGGSTPGITISAGSGSAAAYLNLVGWNAGTPTTAQVFADFSGVLNLSSANGQIQVTTANTTSSAINLNNTSAGGKQYQFASGGSAYGHGAGVLEIQDQSGAMLQHWFYNGTNTIINFNSTTIFGFGSDVFGNSPDVALYRNSAGTFEINSTTPGTFRDMIVRDIYTNDATFFHRSKTTLTNGASVNAGTLTNAPMAGNPTKWIAIDDNGTTRQIPAW